MARPVAIDSHHVPTTTSYVWFYDQMLSLPAILRCGRRSDSGKNQQRLMIAAFSVMNVTPAILIFSSSFRRSGLFGVSVAGWSCIGISFFAIV